MALSPKSAKEINSERVAFPDCKIYEKENGYQQTFINNSAKDVVLSCMGVNLFPSVTMAQMCLESLYGTKHIGQANNYFGFKGNGNPNEFWDGRVITKDTIENYSGTDTTIKDKFRVYDSQLMSLLDRNRLLQTKNYAKVTTANTPNQQAQFIKDCGYATDPDYPKKLVWIIKHFGLEKLDEIKSKIKHV